MPARPPTPHYYLPPAPRPRAPQSPITSTSYTPNKNMNYMSNGQQNPPSPVQAGQRSPQLPKSEPFKATPNIFYNVYQPQVSNTYKYLKLTFPVWVVQVIVHQKVPLLEILIFTWLFQELPFVRLFQISYHSHV